MKKMKKRYCAACGKRVSIGAPKCGEWVSADRKLCIPLYYCSSECMLQHIFLPTAYLHQIRNRIKQ